MIRISTPLLIGNSKDAENINLLRDHGVTAILNTAHDLQGKRGWPDGIVYAQCGLVDGQGNRMSTYHAAILMLSALLDDGKHVLVCDHTGGRSLAVVLMYLHLTGKRGWEGSLAMLHEAHDDLKEPHSEHRKAFDKINWGLLESATALGLS